MVDQNSAETAAPIPSGRVLARIARVVVGEFGEVHFRLIVVGFLARLLPRGGFARTRVQLYRLFGVNIGRRSLILGDLTLSGAAGILERLQIGKECFINSPIFLDVNAGIVIGDGVSIGHHCVLVTSTHRVGDETRRGGLQSSRPISIGNGCWIGACVTVLPGVTIGAGAVVAAGSVVTANVPPNTLAGGVPAHVLKQLDCGP